MTGVYCFLVILFIIFIIIEIALARILPKFFPASLNRIKIVNPDKYNEIDTRLLGIKHELSMLRADLIQIISSHSDHMERATYICNWILSDCTQFGYNVKAASPYQKLKQMRAGRGGHCTDLAQIFLACLTASEVRCRYVLMGRSLFDSKDSHVAVEIWYNKSWCLVDPFFNGIVLIDDQIASANLVHRHLLQNKKTELCFQVFQPTRYPVAHSTYYINPYSMFNFLRVASAIDYKKHFFKKLPFFRFFCGTTYYVCQDKFSMNDYILTKRISELFNLILPIAISILGISIVVLY